MLDSLTNVCVGVCVRVCRVRAGGCVRAGWCVRACVRAHARVWMHVCMCVGACRVFLTGGRMWGSPCKEDFTDWAPPAPTPFQSNLQSPSTKKSL